MRAYMNNLHGLNHEEAYGSGAFFDLDLVGRQAEMLKGMVPNTECFVVSYADRQRKTVVISLFMFDREETCVNKATGDLSRVFFGRLKGKQRLSKQDAARTPEYAPYFNTRGHFKRPSAFYWPPAK